MKWNLLGKFGSGPHENIAAKVFKFGPAIKEEVLLKFYLLFLVYQSFYLAEQTLRQIGKTFGGRCV